MKNLTEKEIIDILNETIEDFEGLFVFDLFFDGVTIISLQMGLFKLQENFTRMSVHLPHFSDKAENILWYNHAGQNILNMFGMLIIEISSKPLFYFDEQRGCWKMTLTINQMRGNLQGRLTDLLEFFENLPPE